MTEASWSELVERQRWDARESWVAVDRPRVWVGWTLWLRETPTLAITVWTYMGGREREREAERVRAASVSKDVADGVEEMVRRVGGDEVSVRCEDRGVQQTSTGREAWARRVVVEGGKKGVARCEAAMRWARDDAG